MKGKILKTDKEWMVEIQSDLHGYGIGWGDPMIYPLFITDENIWEGKEVEVEPIQYDSNFLPVIVKIKTNTIVMEQEEQNLVLMTEPVQENTIVFSAKQEEVLRISQGRFYFRGEEVEDKYQVYERFNEWLTLAENAATISKDK
jgi:hypothetical protein